MIKKLWINLPVKDVAKSRAFYTAIGFKLNEQYGNGEHSASILVGEDNVNLMLFPEAQFKQFTRHEMIDTAKGSEVLFSFDAESPKELDEIMSKVEAAGGSIFAKAGWNQGWMYGSGFCDPDGHRWNILHMDFEKMPK
jgi:uncharacterized protein